MDKKYLENFHSIIGCDEVGRGPIAGPVNACAVKVSDCQTLSSLEAINVTDSKRLSLKKRIKILDELEININKLQLNKVYTVELPGIKFQFCLTEHSHLDIDKMNILKASLSAMKKASDKLIDKLVEKDLIVLIDGNKVFESNAKTEAIVKGDSKSITIGLASIIAKVFRDEKMKDLDTKFPGYNLSQHAGYPTQEHRDAVKKIGPSPIHRKTFKGVKEYL